MQIIKQTKKPQNGRHRYDMKRLEREHIYSFKMGYGCEVVDTN
jgi:hypothetical protein